MAKARESKWVFPPRKTKLLPGTADVEFDSNAFDTPSVETSEQWLVLTEIEG